MTVRSTSRSRPAFTLVELLVVIAIIGVLVALLLPAVQAAREAARRMQCTNHQKQLALAMHNYHDTYGYFPTSFGGTDTGDPMMSNMGQLSGYVSILPFIEQQGLYENILTQQRSFNHGSQQYTDHMFPPFGPAPWIESDLWSNLGYRPWHVELSTLRCPSDGARRAAGWWNDVGRVNYCMSFGDQWTDMWSGASGRGVFSGRWSYKNISGIPDGTSNTVMLSEMTISDGAGGHNTIHGDYWVGSVWVPAECFARKGPSNTILPEGGFNANWETRRAMWWTGGGPTVIGFNTVLPPNSVACTDSAGEWGNNSIFPPDSYHPGGVNVAMADGSVHFISNTIDSGNMSLRPVESGPSPYGVWGALGSRNGREPAMLP